MKTKRLIEILGGIIGIIVGAIVIYQFVLSEPGSVTTAKPDAVREARLQDIANVIEDLTGNQAVQLTSNYDTPLRMLFSASDTANLGVNVERSEAEDVTIIDEPGLAVSNLELEARLEKKFGKSLVITPDSSVSSIYNELFQD